MKKLYRFYTLCLLLLLCVSLFCVQAFAVEDMWTAANRIIVDVYSKIGDTEIFSLTSPWEIAENSRLPLSYDAVVSAVSKAITEQEVLSIVFVLEWGGE